MPPEEAGKLPATPGKKSEADRLTIRLTCRDFELLLLGSLVDPDRQARLMARGGVAM